MANQREITATILIVSDQAVFRRGIRSMIEDQPGWKAVAEAPDRRDAVLQAERLRPDIVIVDINMAGLGGIEAARSILKAMPDARVLAYSATTAEELIHMAMDAGVLGCVFKSNVETELTLAVHALLQGRTFFTAPVFKRIREIWHVGPGKPASSPLTERESEIIRLLAEGKSNRETAAVLGVGIRTVEESRARIMKKLSLKKFGELVRYAIRNSIAEP